MSLFEVPGWSVPSAAPVKSAQSKKRKRPSGDEEKIQSAEVNLEKLLTKLGKGGAEEKKSKKKKSAGGAPRETDREHKAPPKLSKPRHGEDHTESSPHGRNVKKVVSESEGCSNKGVTKNEKRKAKRRDNASLSDQLPAPDAPITPPSAKKAKGSQRQDGLTALQSELKQNLDGARFRWINEVLYKSDSADAHKMMREDPKVYEEYHNGFRHQVRAWPTNPVAHYVTVLSSYPPRTVIADLGCGDASLARALIPKGMTVLSFDLVSDGTFVIEADTCGKLPLPGSEPHTSDEQDNEESEGEGHVVDVVVCALSLMGTNWPNCIREAWRILKSGGELKIAEVASRFTDIEDFISFVGSFGFRLKSKDDRNSHFTLFEFTKVGRKPKSNKEWQKISSRGSILKPCEYKRR